MLQKNNIKGPNVPKCELEEAISHSSALAPLITQLPLVSIQYPLLPYLRAIKMQFPLPLPLACFIYLSCVPAANIRRIPQSQPGPDKTYYNVFPKPGTNESETATFVKITVGTENLQPWTGVNGSLMSWTVEASDDEVVKLKVYAGIDRVTKLDLPAAPTKGADSPAIATRTFPPDGGLVERQSGGVVEYAVIPENGTNQAQCNAIESFLKNLTQSDIVPPLVFENAVDFWIVNLTDNQAAKAKTCAGVLDVVLNALGDPAGAAPETPQPSSTAEPASAKGRRDLSYSTQRNAVTELVAVSQPR